MDNLIDLTEAIKLTPYNTIFDKFSIEIWKKINTKIFLIGPDIEV